MSRPSAQATQDPWSDHGGTERPPHGGRRGRWVLILLVVVIAAAVAIWATSRSSGQPGVGGGGDPGGRILDAIEPVRTAIPAGASDVSTTARDSTYATRCPDSPGGRSGWSAVIVYSNFRSALPAPGLVAAIGAKLTELGWHQVTPLWDHNFDQYRPQAAWQKTLFAGQTATASVYQLPAGNGPYTGSWHFSAVAKPPGFALPGC